MSRLARNALGGLIGAALSCSVIAQALGEKALGTGNASSSMGRSEASGRVRSVVDRIAAQAVQRRQIPHLMVAVSRQGEQRYFSYGSGAPDGFAKDTIVEIGSITKTFTAALYAQAVHDGLMRPDGSIQDYLPKDVSLGRCASAVTLQDLADFRSGMPLLPTDVPRSLVNRSIRRYTVSDFYGWLSAWSPVEAGNPNGSGSLRERCGLPAAYGWMSPLFGTSRRSCISGQRPWTILAVLGRRWMISRYQGG